MSIIPRVIAALGYTLQAPTEDRYLLTRGELLDRLDVMLGGRAAETVVFNEISTGAKNDLDKATELTCTMVTSYGMSETIGPLSYDRGGTLFLNVPGVGREKEYSEETARPIDAEVRSVLVQAQDTALKLLTDRQEALAHIASVLLQKEVLEGQELKDLLKQHGAA